MAGTLSPAARVKLAELATLLEKVQRAHALVEQYGVAKSNQEQLVLAVGRQFAQLKYHFMGAGFDAMSQLAGSMEMAARRGLSAVAKLRILREGVASLRFQVELAQRAVVTEEQASQRRADEARGAAEPGGDSGAG
jgi:hypothetical protein